MRRYKMTHVIPGSPGRLHVTYLEQNTRVTVYANASMMMMIYDEQRMMFVVVSLVATSRNMHGERSVWKLIFSITT